MYENANIEVIARGVCIVNDQILLCHAKKSNLTYLPGGHIEFGETGRIALEREIAEEMGHVATAGQFMGCCEHTFIQKGERHCEINLVYEMKILDCAVDAIDAIEDWIGFKWVPLAELPNANLEPRCLIDTLTTWLIRPDLCESGYNS